MKDKITIAIPIYNEITGVYELIKKVHKLKLNKEIMILDDGSTFRDTKKIILQLKKDFPTATFIESKKNMGKTRIIMAGLRKAKGNIFVILDSDSELDPNDIPRLYNKLKSADASFVNGIRVVAKNKFKKTFTYVITQTAKYFFGMITKLFLGASIEDVLCGYKMFYTDDFRNYNFSTQKFGLETELLGETLRSKRKIVQEYVNYYPRTYKEGKKIQLYHGIEVLEIILKKAPTYILAKNLLIALIIFFIAFFSFTFSIRFFNTTDSYPNNFTALNILFNKRIDLTNLKNNIQRRGIITTTIKNKEGKLYSKTPPILGVLSVPTFAVLNKYYGISYLSPQQIVESDYSQYIGKISASFYVALSAVILYFIIDLLVKNQKIALVATLTFIYTTNVFNTASQANWQHGFSLFFITLFIYLIIKFSKYTFVLFFIGMLAGLLTQVRISNGFYLIFPLIYLLLQKTKSQIIKLILYILGFVLVYGGIILLNQYFKIPYGYGNEIKFSFQIFNPILFVKNMMSLLFSINYGLFIYSPILLLSVFAVRKILLLRDRKEYSVIVSLIPTLLLFILFASFWWTWIGGTSLNARLLTESLPILMILLAYTISDFNKNYIFKAVFISLFSYSLFINLLTTYCIDWWWFSKYQKGGYKNQLSDAWYTKPSLFVYLLKTRLINRETIYRDGEKIMVHRIIYRPTLETKKIVVYENKTYELITPSNSQTR